MARVRQLVIPMLVSCMLLPNAAEAAVATTTFQVSATVLKACLVTANALNFGSYDPTATTALAGSTTISVLCTVGTSYTVGLNAGTASGATVTTRKMSNGTDVLSYGLYQDTSHTQNWGNSPGTDTPASATALITPTTLTVYGLIPAGQNVPVNTYTDTITVSVNY